MRCLRSAAARTSSGRSVAPGWQLPSRPAGVSRVILVTSGAGTLASRPGRPASPASSSRQPAHPARWMSAAARSAGPTAPRRYTPSVPGISPHPAPPVTALVPIPRVPAQPSGAAGAPRTLPVGQLAAPATSRVVSPYHEQRPYLPKPFTRPKTEESRRAAAAAGMPIAPTPPPVQRRPGGWVARTITTLGITRSVRPSYSRREPRRPPSRCRAPRRSRSQRIGRLWLKGETVIQTSYFESPTDRSIWILQGSRPIDRSEVLPALLECARLSLAGARRPSRRPPGGRPERGLSVTT